MTQDWRGERADREQEGLREQAGLEDGEDDDVGDLCGFAEL